MSSVEDVAFRDCMKLIRARDYVSWVEVKQTVEKAGISTQGNFALTLTEYPNVALWTDMSESFVKIGLRLGRECQLARTQILVYAVDGVLLNLPVATKIRDYKSLRWLPTTLRPPEAVAQKSKAKRIQV